MTKNILIAHRGIYNNTDIPENSISAFKKAIKYNYPIELDVQLTKDNILVVFHDKNLKRMTNSDKTVNELTYTQLKNLKLLNTNQTIPTLEQVLNLVNGKIDIYIEIKATKRINKICNVLNEQLRQYSYNHIIQSFNFKVISWFKKNNPSIYRGLLMNKKLYNSFLGKIIIKYCNPNFLSISKKYVDEYELNCFYNKYNIIIWTIKDYNEIKKYKKITNTFICNNLPFLK